MKYILFIILVSLILIGFAEFFRDYNKCRPIKEFSELKDVSFGKMKVPGNATKAYFLDAYRYNSYLLYFPDKSFIELNQDYLAMKRTDTISPDSSLNLTIGFESCTPPMDFDKKYVSYVYNFHIPGMRVRAIVDANPIKNGFAIVCVEINKTQNQKTQ